MNPHPLEAASSTSPTRGSFLSGSQIKSDFTQPDTHGELSEHSVWEKSHSSPPSSSLLSSTAPCQAANSVTQNAAPWSSPITSVGLSHPLGWQLQEQPQLSPAPRSLRGETCYLVINCCTVDESLMLGGFTTSLIPQVCQGALCSRDSERGISGGILWMQAAAVMWGYK